MRLSIADFDELTPQEFNHALTGFNRAQEKALDNQLWQTRFLSSVIASFSMKTKKAVEPKKFFLLPGEKRIKKEKAQHRDLKQLHGAAMELMRKKNKEFNQVENGGLSAD